MLPSVPGAPLSLSDISTKLPEGRAHTGAYDTIVQATSGEPEAVNTVLQYYGRRIRYASRISGQADKEAEDFITETLLKALFKFRFSRVSPPDTTE